MPSWPVLLLFAATAPWQGEPGPRPVAAGDYAGVVDRSPVTQWSRALPGARPNPSTHSELARPLVLQDSFFIGSTGQDALFELSRDDGSILRSLEAGAPVKAQPVRGGQDSIVFSDGAGYTWHYGLDGALLWRHFAGAPVLSSPAVHDDTVYVSALDGTVWAIGLGDGEVRWLYTHPGDRSREAELELYGAPAPVPAGDLLLAGFHDGRLVALERADGAVRWEAGVGEGRYPDLIAEALVSGDDVYVGGFSAPFSAMDLATQNIRWSLEFGVASASVLHERTLYVPGADGKLRALDKLTGSIVWEWDSETSGALSQPQITQAGVFVGSSDGSLWLVDQQAGETLWTYDEGHMLNGISVAPVVDGRQVLVVTNAGNLISLVVPPAAQAPDSQSEPPWAPPFASVSAPER